MSNTSTETNFNAIVDQISVYIYSFTIPFGLCTNLINILILSRRSLRSSSCTYYFLSLAIACLIYINGSPLSIYFRIRFGILLGGSPVSCRVMSTMIYSSALFVTWMLMFASIDRCLSSSSSIRLRQYSQVRIAQRLIPLVLLLTLIYSSPFSLINYWNSSSNRCLQSSSTLITVHLSSRIILYYFIGPFIMAVFGLLTISNIRHQTSRIAPVAMKRVGQTSQRRSEGQLARMLIIQVGAYIIFSTPSAITYTITTFIPSMNTPVLTGLRTISLMWQQGTYLLTMFLYTLTANVYRQEMIKVFRLHFLVKKNKNPM